MHTKADNSANYQPNYLPMTRHATSLQILACLILATPFLGCVPAPRQLTFALSEETEKLPETHKQQIVAFLTDYFGTPVDPHLRLPSTESGKPGVATRPEQLRQGAVVFERLCAGCHGFSGDGQGEAAAYLQPKPRDYRRGAFKFTSTPYGAKPQRSDLAQVIRRGAKGTSMPPFRFLPDDDLQAVIDYVVMLSHRGELERTVVQIAQTEYEADEKMEESDFIESLTRIHETWEQAQHQVVHASSAPPKISDETILAGRKAFLNKGCSKCHGDDFRGQTEWLSREFLAAQLVKPEDERTKINYDAWGQPAPAADLTSGMLHGGRRPIDIYRRIHSGINGTPMPSFEQALASEPQTLWHLVHYVLSTVEGREVAGINDVVGDPVPMPKEP